MEIKTYIKIKKIISSLKDIDEKQQQHFVCFDSEESLQYIEDYDYVEGAIIIRSEGESILDFKYWDLVDQLWVYLIEAIYEMINTENEIKFYFPDQSVELKMRIISKYTVLISVDGKKHIVDKMDFLNSILESAEQFFKLLGKGNNGRMSIQCETQLTTIMKIKDKLKLEEYDESW